MKKIHTANFLKLSDDKDKDYLVDKDDGFYETIRESFDDFDNEGVAEDMIAEFQSEEAEENQYEEYENGILNNLLTELSDETIEDAQFQSVGSDGLSNLNDVQRETMYAMSDSEQITIVYITKNGHKINRTIQPLEAFLANNGNRILLTWCLDWNDYRAFIIDNIISIVENEVKE